jgi:ABC-type amino acid transport substrate-binding protein
MRFVCRVLALLLLSASLLHAEPPKKLRMGIFDRPPFAMKDDTGHWTGLAVEVWERVATDLGLEFEYVETPFDRIVDDAAAGRLDIVMGEIGVSPDRAQKIEFTQPYLARPAAVAMVKAHRPSHLFQFLRGLLSHDEVGVILLILFGALVIFSLLLWLVEHRVERTHFGGDPVKGIGSALWFAAVTMTTVGYGDKTPQSTAGRVVVFFWMFFGVVLVSVFTGAIASSLAVMNLNDRIEHVSDLARYRAGVLDDSIAQTVLSHAGVRTQVFPSDEAGLKALQARQINAFADGEVTLNYLANNNYPGELVLEPLPTTHIMYAFAVRPDFSAATLKAMNVELIGQSLRANWEQEIEHWIGPPAR